MNRLLAGMLIATGLGSFAAAFGQEPTVAGSSRSYDVAAGFTAVRANAAPGQCGCFFMYGGSAQGVVNLPSPFSLVTDFGFTRAKNVNGSGDDLTLTTYQAGFRYAEVYRNNWKPYAQILVGAGHLKSSFLFDSGSTSLAYTAGAGLDYHLTHQFSLRVFQAEYLGTRFPNAVNDRQGQVRLTAGLVFHLSKFHLPTLLRR